jgi:uncharacterized protein (TIGR02391 family)
MGLSKNQLKRMYLKVLYECEYGTMKGCSWGTDSINPYWINEYWGVEMTDEDKKNVNEAIQELKIAGLIVKDPNQKSDVFQILTEKGKELVERQKDPDVHGVQLERIIRNPPLLAKCLDSFRDDDYEEAIFLAYKQVEEEVRNKAGLGPEDVGESLMTKALHPKTGKLIVPSCKAIHEQEEVYNLFKGAIAFFKDPSSNRTVNYGNRIITIEIIAFADLLLQIISTAQLK